MSGLNALERSGGRVRVLSAQETRALQISFQEAQQKREDEKAERRRRLHMDVQLSVGPCKCGGVIRYKSSYSFIRTGPLMFGGPSQGYWQEHVRCFCDASVSCFIRAISVFANSANELKVFVMEPFPNRQKAKSK